MRQLAAAILALQLASSLGGKQLTLRLIVLFHCPFLTTAVEHERVYSWSPMLAFPRFSFQTVGTADPYSLRN